MARKVKDIAIDADNRDKGKKYRLTEMPATQAERWAQRALFAIGKTNPEMPEDVASTGMAGFAAFGIRALAAIPWGEAEPLLDEMFSCVQLLPSSGVPRALMEDDIEEVSTRLKLRSEVIELHTGFSLAASLSTLGQAAKGPKQAGRKRSTSRPPSQR